MIQVFNKLADIAYVLAEAKAFSLRVDAFSGYAVGIMLLGIVAIAMYGMYKIAKVI